MTVIFINRCAHTVLGEGPPDLPSGENSEPILTFMERTYKAGRARATYDAGEPLLLTPFIEEKKLKEGRKAAAVDSDYLLPDMDSYAGYLTVSYILYLPAKATIGACPTCALKIEI